MVLLFELKIEPFFGGVYPEKIQWLLKLTTIYYTGGPSGGPLLRLNSLAVMLLGHGSDGKPQVYAQLGQHTGPVFRFWGGLKVCWGSTQPISTPPTPKHTCKSVYGQSTSLFRRLSQSKWTSCTRSADPGGGACRSLALAFFTFRKVYSWAICSEWCES